MRDQVFLSGFGAQDDRQREPSVDAVFAKPCETLEAAAEEVVEPTALSAAVETAVENAMNETAPAVDVSETVSAESILDAAESLV